MARTLHPKLGIFDSSNPEKQITNFTAIPTWFVDDLFRCGKGIPSSFWKFTYVLMRHILSPSKIDDAFVFDYTWKSTFDDFKQIYDIGDLAVQDWSNAYSCSGLFSMIKGSRKHPNDPNGKPTQWKYWQGATRRDWFAFIIALSKTLNPPDGKRMRRHGWSCLHPHPSNVAHSDGCIDCSEPYKLKLAIEVDKARKDSVGHPPLPPINVQRIERFLSRGYGVLDEDGTIHWTRVTPNTPKEDAENAEQHRRYGS